MARLGSKKRKERKEKKERKLMEKERLCPQEKSNN